MSETKLISDLRSIATSTMLTDATTLKAVDIEMRASAKDAGSDYLASRLAEALYNTYYRYGNVDNFLRSHRVLKAQQNFPQAAPQKKGVLVPVQERRAAGVPSNPDADKLLDLPFQRYLHSMNASKETWDSGWALLENRGHQADVARGDDRRTVNAEDFRQDEGTIRSPKGEIGGTGWYFFRGDLPESVGQRIRFYWSVSRMGAGPLVQAITREFNAEHVPFLAKIPGLPNDYSRADACVIYLADTDVPRSGRALERVYSSIAHYLRPNTPPFAKKIASGLAAAEAPTESTLSFGTHRCLLVARGILQAGVEATPDARFDSIVAQFDAANVDLQRPYQTRGANKCLDHVAVSAPAVIV